MANTTIQLKRSSVAGKQPNTSTISVGELAINLTDKKLYSSDGSNIFEPAANVTNLNVTANATISAIVANGSLGTPGQVLTTNSTGIYWESIAGSGTVTSVDSGDGLSGGPITDSGTISVLANNGISANSTGVFVVQGTGTVVNATGVHVNSVYIGTLAANSATYLGGNTASDLRSYSDTIAGTAYSNAVSYADTIAGTAYSNATSYADTAAATAYSNATSYAASNTYVNSTFAPTADPTFTGNATFDTSTLFVDGTNNRVGIGTSSPAYILDVNGNINASGTVYATHFDNVSDISLKENIITISSPKDIIDNLNPVSFNWKDTGEKSFGFIAQEVEKILPEIVHTKTDNTKTVSYIQLIPFLIQIIKEQQQQIDDINNKLNNA